MPSPPPEPPPVAAPPPPASTVRVAAREASAPPPAPSTEPDVFETLSDGTRFETPVIVVPGSAPGPTALVIAGIHGDEPAAPHAAAALAKWQIGRGLLYIIPRANPPAIEVGKRRTPRSKYPDLNRNFPVHSADTVRGLTAGGIWDVVTRIRPDWIVDLHEGIDFNRHNPNSVGSSVLYNRPIHDLAPQAQRLVDVVNLTVPEPWRKFTVLQSTAPGSLVRAAAERLGTRAFILETTSHSVPVEARAEQHLIMLERLLADLELEPQRR